MPPPDPQREPSICLGCGICCDGTLYSRAKVAPGEEEKIAGYGLHLFEFRDKTYFRQGCRLFRSGACTIYEDRFTICRTFRCRLLRKVEEGRIAAPDARQIIARALDARARVAEREPGAVLDINRARIRDELSRQLEDANPPDKLSLGARLLSIVALDELLDRHFRNPRKGASTSDKD